MQIGISTACFYPQPVEEIFARLAKMDFSLCEIFFNTDGEMQEPLLSVLREQTQQHGIAVRSVHPYTSLMEGVYLFSNYSRRTQEGLARYRAYLRNAKTLGASYLTLHGERHMDAPIERQIAPYKLDAYRALCDIAGEEGMQIAQENVVWCKSSAPHYLACLREQVPDLRYTLDLKQAARAKTPWQDYLAVMGDRLVNVHINDQTATQSCLLPGEGDFDYTALRAALQAVGYAGDALIEVYGANFTEDAQVLRAAAYLRKIFG